MALSSLVFVHSGALRSARVIRALQWAVRTRRGAEGSWDRAPLHLRRLGPESVVSLQIELLTVIAFCAIVCLKWTPKNSRRGEVGYFGSAANSWECGFMRALSPAPQHGPAAALPHRLRRAWPNPARPAQIAQASDAVFKCARWLGCSVAPTLALGGALKGPEPRECLRVGVLTSVFQLSWKLMANSLFCFSNRNKILQTYIFLICHCPWMSKNLKICSNHLDKLFLQGYYGIPVAQVEVLALLGKHAALALLWQWQELGQVSCKIKVEREERI